MTPAKATFRLWTPIANAFDAYRRRVLASTDAVYEHVWRLIHIHESTIVCLGSLLSSRLLALWTTESLDDADRLRQRLTGLAAPALPTGGVDVPRGEACLDGYINPWVTLLKEFSPSGTDPTNCQFSEGLSKYLLEKVPGPLAFLDSWKTLADVPGVFAETDLSRIDRFSH
jgi:hypothetical protein